MFASTAIAKSLPLLLATMCASVQDEPLGGIKGRVQIPPKYIPSLTKNGGKDAIKILLNGGLQSCLPDFNGDFAFEDLPSGAHLLQVVHPTLQYDPVLVEVKQAKTKAFIADPEKNDGKGAKLKVPLQLKPSSQNQYLEKREEFDLLSIFKSPMTLLSLFSFGMMFLLPKMQPMIEEQQREQKARLEEQQQQQARRRIREETD
mmetsp:Transcript_123791/g.194173  ORF Transcript_123791/g.194173 Transcript_123791/m.194173 type:complete len:203 (+) Transcript_123791:80-688(+)